MLQRRLNSLGMSTVESDSTSSSENGHFSGVIFFFLLDRGDKSLNPSLCVCDSIRDDEIRLQRDFAYDHYELSRRFLRTVPSRDACDYDEANAVANFA